MKIAFICMGKTNFSFLREGIELYKNRIDHYINFEVIEIPDKKQGGSDMVSITKREGEAILSKIAANDFLVILDEKGKEMASVEFAKFLSIKMNQQAKRIIFAIGGAYGFSEAVYDRADASFSLSKLTFSHQLVRIIFLEQLYRAFTILRGEPYHHS